MESDVSWLYTHFKYRAACQSGASRKCDIAHAHAHNGRRIDNVRNVLRYETYQRASRAARGRRGRASTGDLYSVWGGVGISLARIVWRQMMADMNKKKILYT